MTDSRSSNQSEKLDIPWRDAPRYFFPEHAQKYDAAVRVWRESGARIGGRAVFTGHWTETPDYSRPDKFRMERILPPEAKAVEFAEQDLRLAFWSAIKDCQLLVCFRFRADQESVPLDADDVERLRLQCNWEGIVPGHLFLRRSQLFDVNVRRPTIEEKTSFFTVHPRGEWRVVSAEEVFRPANMQAASMAREGASSAIQAPSTPRSAKVDLPLEPPLWLDCRGARRQTAAEHGRGAGGVSYWRPDRSWRQSRLSQMDLRSNGNSARQARQTTIPSRKGIQELLESHWD